MIHSVLDYMLSPAHSRMFCTVSSDVASGLQYRCLSYTVSHAMADHRTHYDYYDDIESDLSLIRSARQSRDPLLERGL